MLEQKDLIFGVLVTELADRPDEMSQRISKFKEKTLFFLSNVMKCFD